VKWRNQLLALFCLIVFLAFGVFYFQHWVVQKPFGIILFVGEGLDPARLAMARIYAGGAETPLTIDSLPYTALLKNYSLDFSTPDQAAAGTALATGTKVKNGALGIDPDGNTLQNLLELARESGRMTGLVTDAVLTNPAVASFYAHTAAQENRAELARSLAETSEIDVVLGGGAADFLPARKGGGRADDSDLVLELRGRGYDVVQNLEELDAVPRWRRAKLLGLFSAGELAFADQVEARGDQPTLSDMVRRGIELLQFNGGGYLLVVNAGLMGKAAREKSTERALSETVELDRAISIALRYAGAKSTVIVCGDVAVGGLNLNGFPPREPAGTSLLKPAADGPRFTWATGPARGPDASSAAPEQPLELEAIGEPGTARSEVEAPAAIEAPFALPCAADVIAFGTGLGADALQGTLESTAIFEIIRDNL
jgi:alkaline phosphatase